MSAGGGTGTIVQKGGTSITVSHGLVGGKLQIGFEWADASQINTAFTAVGGFSAPVANNKAQEQAVVDYINSHGGIDGYPIDPVYYKFNVANLETQSGRAQEAQAECATWTQDNHVFAMTVVANPNDSLLTCAKNTNTPLLSSNFGQFLDNTEYQSMPDLFYDPSGITINQEETLEVTRMVQAGVLGPKTKLGVLISGTSPMFQRAANQTLFPLLQQNHIQVASKVVYPDDIDAPWDTYVLQFRQAGVNTVYFDAVDGTGWAETFFFKAADNQKWNPEYVMGSDLGTQGSASSDQAQHIHGAGWMPFEDTGSEAYQSPNASLCAQVMKNAGQPMWDVINAGPATCELMFFLQAALRGSASITPQGLAAGAERLGTGYGTILTKGANFAPGFHYAADIVQNFAYNAQCNCIAYVDGPTRFR